MQFYNRERRLSTFLCGILQPLLCVSSVRGTAHLHTDTPLPPPPHTQTFFYSFSGLLELYADFLPLTFKTATTQAHIHTQTQTCRQADIHTQTYSTNTQTHTRVRTHRHARVQTQGQHTRESDRQVGRQTDRQTNNQTDTWHFLRWIFIVSDRLETQGKISIQYNIVRHRP